jgi:hypothetical protein
MFEAQKAVNGRLKNLKLKFEVCFDFFPSHQVIFILALQSGRPGFRAVILRSWSA